MQAAWPERGKRRAISAFPARETWGVVSFGLPFQGDHVFLAPQGHTGLSHNILALVGDRQHTSPSFPDTGNDRTTSRIAIEEDLDKRSTLAKHHGKVRIASRLYSLAPRDIIAEHKTGTSRFGT